MTHVIALPRRHDRSRPLETPTTLPGESVVARATDDDQDGVDDDRSRDDPAGDGGRRAPWRRALSGLFTLLLLAAVVYLWPVPLGGSTRLVVVTGDSMEPTYDYGDIVVTRDRSGTEVGDAVVFALPDGGAEGMLVIHRVLLVDDEGFFITQGDNRTTPDTWQLTEDDIVGQPLLHVPHGGHVIWFLQQRSVLGVLIGLLVVVVLWPKREDHGAGDEDDATHDRDDGSAAGVVDLVARPGWSEQVIDEATMVAANAWLDAVLADVEPSDNDADRREHCVWAEA